MRKFLFVWELQGCFKEAGEGGFAFCTRLRVLHPPGLRVLHQPQVLLLPWKTGQQK